MKLKAKLYTIIALSVATIFCCQTEKTKNEETVSSHLGAWEMIYFQSIAGDDTTTIMSDSIPLAITLLTPAHFSYQWRNSPNSGAGTYSYDGKIIRQVFKYVEDSNFVGATLSFKMVVRNDSLIFSGPVDAISSSGNNIMNQIPQMLEIRRRAK